MMLKSLFSPVQQQYPPQYPQQYPPQYNYPDFNRFQNEISELKRMNSELLKRVARLENYLGIRDSENLY